MNTSPSHLIWQSRRCEGKTVAKVFPPLPKSYEIRRRSIPCLAEMSAMAARTEGARVSRERPMRERRSSSCTLSWMHSSCRPRERPSATSRTTTSRRCAPRSSSNTGGFPPSGWLSSNSCCNSCATFRQRAIELEFYSHGLFNHGRYHFQFVAATSVPCSARCHACNDPWKM